MMSIPRLVIGNKNYSSWSLRAWLLLAKLGLEFEEVLVPLGQKAGLSERILAYSPAAKVPVYIEGDQAVWDSLAIAEYLAEAHPQLWPSERSARAHARAISAEMHSGFAALRQSMPMNCRARGRLVPMGPELAADIERIQAIWLDCRTRYAEQGPWLLGAFSIADAMYAPVVSRFNTYAVSVGSPLLQAYMHTVLQDEAMVRWYQAAEQEPEVVERAEVGRQATEA